MHALQFTAEAIKALARVPRNVSKLIRDKLDRLAEDPFPPNSNVRALSGRPAYQLRVGDYRVIYELHDDQLVIVVVAVGAQGSVYE